MIMKMIVRDKITKEGVAELSEELLVRKHTKAARDLLTNKGERYDTGKPVKRRTTS